MRTSASQLNQPAERDDDGRVDPDIQSQLDQGPAAIGDCRVDLAVAELAAKQAGNVARRQLFRLGLTASAIDYRVATGRLHVHYRGVYLVGHMAEAKYADEWGAVLACGEGAVVSHRRGMEVFELVESSGGPVDISIPSRSSRQRPGIRLHRQPSLDRRDTGFSQGVPITSPARTLLDFATEAELRELERAFHEALVQRLVTRKQVDGLLRRVPGHHGAPLVRSLIDDRGALTLTRSEAEELLLALIRSARLPRPEVNARVLVYEVDFLWRAQRLVVEVDGGRWHGNRAALERDHRKNARLRAAGYEVLRYTYTQIRDDRDAVVAELARATAAPPR